VPGVFVFVLDLSLKYIVLLGGVIVDLLTARELRAVGRDRHPYRSVGGVLGQTFLRSVRLSRETWEAMCCRCFTDDYKGL
jgi:cobalt/nickel transport system permease protein